MAEEGKITMNEFKTVVETIRTDIKKVVEVVNHRFDRVEHDVKSLKHEVGRLHEGQTEIKAELRTGLKNRVTYADLNKLEKRVVRLENKVA